MNNFIFSEIQFPTSVQTRLELCSKLQQNPAYHPEGDVLTHIKIVCERAAQFNNRVLLCAATLHDICKADTAQINPKTGFNSFIGHEFAINELIKNDKSIQNYIQNFCGSFDAIETVRRICKYHMKIHDLAKFKSSTYKRYVDLWEFEGIFELLKMHSACDNMLMDFDIDNWEKSCKFNRTKH